MKKSLFFLLVSLLLSACSLAEDRYISRIRFDVAETKITQVETEDGTYTLGEEGDTLKFNVNVRPTTMAEEIRMSMINGDQDTNYSSVSGILVFENGEWICYEKVGDGYNQTSVVIVSSPRKDANLFISIAHFDIANRSILVKTFSKPFIEGDDPVTVNLADLFSSPSQHVQ